MKWHFLTVVWGKEYIKTFLNIGLPFQLTKGNFQYIKNHAEITYKIFTHVEDVDTIKNSESYKKLSEFINVQIITQEFSKAQSSKPVFRHRKMNEFHQMGIDEANKEEAAITFLFPDIIMSKDSLKNLLSIIKQGKRYISILPIRLCKEDFIHDLEKQYTLNNGFYELTCKELIQLGLRVLHPYSKESIWNDKKTTISSWPAYLYWKLGNDAIVGRCFHIHPIFVWPEKKDIKLTNTVDYSYVYEACPNKETWKIVDNAEDIAIFDVTSKNELKVPIVKKSSYFISSWMKTYLLKDHINNFKTKIIYKSQENDSNLKKLEIESDEFEKKIMKQLLNPSILDKVILYFFQKSFKDILKIIFPSFVIKFLKTFLKSPKSILKKMLLKSILRKILPKFMIDFLKTIRNALKA